MSATATALTERLQMRFKPFTLQVWDESADHAGHAGSSGADHGTHFRVRIGCDEFLPLNRVAQHRLVYDSLQDFIAQGLHALAIEVVRPPKAATLLANT